MNFLPGENCLSKSILMLGSVVLLVSSISRNAHAQYSDELKDVVTKSAVAGVEPGQQRPVPIGNLGAIVSVVDLRGFVPMSFYSAAAEADAQKNRIRLDNLFPDLLRWYKVPTKKALLMLYFGDLSPTHIADDTSRLEDEKFSKTRFLQEAGAQGESARWCKAAYKIDSSTLYERIVGGSGFEAGEPTTLFFTDQSVFIIVSLKFNSPVRRKSTGQVLVAFEFARSSREYKTFYKLYSNEMMSKATSEAFAKTAPLIAHVLKEVF